MPSFNIRHYLLALKICLLFVAYCAFSSQAQTITVAWRSKPPNQYLDNGIGKGPLFELATRVFTATGLEVHFVEEPAKRIWNNFTKRTPNYCSFGWYKTDQRKNLVQFSASFSNDFPHTILVNNKFLNRIRTHGTLASLLKDPKLSRAVVDGVSYGEELDELLLTSTNKVVMSSAAPMIMARMINADRASFMIIDRDDWAYISREDHSLTNLTQIDFPDMPPGIDRYIVCSLDVPKETMTKLNFQIAKYRINKN